MTITQFAKAFVTIAMIFQIIAKAFSNLAKPIKLTTTVESNDCSAITAIALAIRLSTMSYMKVAGKYQPNAGA